VPVVCCSALTEEGLDELWQRVVAHRKALVPDGRLAQRRSDQQVAWVRSMVRDRLLDRFGHDERVRRLQPELEAQVRAGELTATLAAERLLETVWPAGG